LSGSLAIQSYTFSFKYTLLLDVAALADADNPSLAGRALIKGTLEASVNTTY
jgi:hypothetical protein